MVYCCCASVSSGSLPFSGFCCCWPFLWTVLASPTWRTAGSSHNATSPDNKSLLTLVSHGLDWASNRCDLCGHTDRQPQSVVRIAAQHSSSAARHRGQHPCCLLTNDHYCRRPNEPLGWSHRG